MGAGGPVLDTVGHALEVQHARDAVAIRNQAPQAPAQQGGTGQIGRAFGSPEQEHGRAVGLIGFMGGFFDKPK
jgi:hypothetical protein